MKTGRNDPCPCGSGKKYKQCCLNSNIIPFPAAGDLNPVEFARMSGFGSAAELDEDMARYSQYCEALPDNAPIPSMMEFSGRAPPASWVLNNLKSEIAGKDFGSIEELTEFFGAQVDNLNNHELISLDRNIRAKDLFNDDEYTIQMTGFIYGSF